MQSAMQTQNRNHGMIWSTAWKKNHSFYFKDENWEKNWYNLDTSELGLGNHHIKAGPMQLFRTKDRDTCLFPLKTYILCVNSYSYAFKLSIGFNYLLSIYHGTKQDRPELCSHGTCILLGFFFFNKVSSFIKLYVLSLFLGLACSSKVIPISHINTSS